MIENRLFEDRLFNIAVFDQSLIVEDLRTGDVRMLSHSLNLKLREFLSQNLGKGFDFSW